MNKELRIHKTENKRKAVQPQIASTISLVESFLSNISKKNEYGYLHFSARKRIQLSVLYT